MNKILTLSILTLILFSCSDKKEQSIEEIIASGDIELIRSKRTEIEKQKAKYSQQLESLDNKISELDDNKKTPLITTIKAQEAVFNHSIEIQGNVTTQNLLVLYPEFAGVLKNINVEEGQHVTKGQTLATIDDGGLNQQLAQLKIQANLSKTTFEKQERLWNQKIGSELQYLQAKSNYEAQSKAVSQLQEQIEKTIVKAPFSGIIDDIITEQGSMVSPGVSPLIRIVNLDDMYIETDVPERYMSTITKNKNVTIELPVLGKTIDSKIKETGNYINPANRTFKVTINVPNKEKDIKPNLTAKLKINDYSNEKALLIPQSIISENALGEQYIYIVANKKGNIGVAKKTIISTGKTEGDVIEVLEGIKDGDEIIKEGARSIKEGQKVKIKTLAK